MVEPERNWRAAVGARRPEGKRDRCGRWRPVGAGKWDPHKPLAKGSSAIQPRLPRTQRQEGSAAYATCGERTAATPKSAFEVFRAEGHAVIASWRPIGRPWNKFLVVFLEGHSEKKQEGYAFLQPPQVGPYIRGRWSSSLAEKKKSFECARMCLPPRTRGQRWVRDGSRTSKTGSVAKRPFGTGQWHPNPGCDGRSNGPALPELPQMVGPPSEADGPPRGGSNATQTRLPPDGCAED